MKKKFHPLYWLIINTILLGGGILLPWFNIGFEPHNPPLNPFLGFEYIIGLIRHEVEDLVEYGFDWYEISFILVEVSGILIIAYLIFNIGRIIKPITFRGNKVLSLALLIVTIVFLYHASIRDILTPTFGFWFFISGLISSAIFEWLNSSIAS